MYAATLVVSGGAGEVRRAHRLRRDDQEGEHVHQPVAELPGAVRRCPQQEERRARAVSAE